MSISATSSTGTTPLPPSSSAAAQTAATAKTDTTPVADTPKDTASPQDGHFNTQMPPQPISNGLGQTIGRHLNLRA